MKRINLLLIFFILSLVGCSGDYAIENIMVKFQYPIKKRTIDLSKKEGETFTVFDDYDTITYNLTYDKKLDINYLVKESVDTIFEGTVTKLNELYLLNNYQKDSTYFIHALEFTDSTITGLDTEWEQSILIYDEVLGGKYKEFIVDSTFNITLNVNKKIAKEIFRNVIQKLEPEKRLILIDTEQEFETEVDSVKTDSFIKKADGYIYKVYPNPFTYVIFVDMKESVPYIFQLFDMNGNLIKKMGFDGDGIVMDLSEQSLSSGTYILKVFTEKHELLETTKLIKL